MDREAGANSLRGGRNTYTSKCRIGNFVEEEYRPEIQRKGFSQARYVTTTMEQQLQGAAKDPREPLSYGKGVKEVESERFDYQNIVCPDKHAASAKWETVTQSCYKDNTSPPGAEFSTTFHLKGGVKGSKLAEYRDEWTHDSAVGAKMRFSTTAMHADTAVDPTTKFGSRQTRALPGTPLAVEKLRQRLVDAKGHAAMQALRREFSVIDTSGDGVLQFEELRKGIERLGAKMSDADAKAIFNFFDRSGDGTVDINEFAVRMRGEMKESRVSMVQEIFAKLDKTGDGVVTIDDLRGVYNVGSSEDQASADDKLQKFLEQWDVFEKDGTITFDDFREYYHDLGSLIEDDVYFEWMLRSAWKFESAYIAQNGQGFKGHNTTSAW